MTLLNRAVMAPVTRIRDTSLVYVPNGDLTAEYYDQRSKYIGTLIDTEVSFICPAASGYDNAPGVSSDEQNIQ